MSTDRVVIIGASHAGVGVCASLRQDGWAGEIVMIGDEASLPYQRPPLSKALLAGESTVADGLLRRPEFYAKEQITVRQGHVAAIHRESRTLELGDGERLDYGTLVVCTGASPRPLPIPGAELSGVHALRSAADADAIRTHIRDGARAVIIGAGYIGLETAASLRRLGLSVTVLEAADRVLGRVTAPEMSAFFDRVHREEGVDLRVGVGVAAIEGRDTVSGVRLGDGEVLGADLVIVGIGVVPNVELAEAAGLAVDNGIVIDAHGRTEDPDIFAAGDCTNYPDARYQRRLRLECVANAVEQAKAVSATICGRDRPITALPWFWSDQFDVKLQIAGLSTGYDAVVLRGDPEAGRSFACFSFVEGRLIAADCVNRPQEFMFAKRAIAEGLSPAPALLADPDTALASLLRLSSPSAG